MKDKTYILYLANSGGGTHIIRSMMMEMNKNGQVEPIVQGMYWARAAAALNYPDEQSAIGKHKGDGQISNLEFYREFCEQHGIDLGDRPLSQSRIFEIFEKIYYRKGCKPYFDFMGRYYSTVENQWTQKYVDALQALILKYYKCSEGKFQLKFIVQVRNPLDHIVSLSERFQKENAMQHYRNTVVSNMINLEKIIPELAKGDMLYLKFEDIVRNFSGVQQGFREILHLEAPSEFYLSDISLDKWMTSPLAYQFLSDRQLIEVSRRFSFTFTNFPGPLKALYFFLGTCRREIREMRLIRDVISGKVNEYNPVLNKHSKKGILSRLYLMYLFVCRRSLFEKYQGHRNRFDKLLFEHNMKVKHGT